MEDLFFAMVPITLFVTIGGVLILRPLTRRLGLMLEANAASKRATEVDRMQYDHLRTLLETQSLKIDALEQRLQFTEGLLDGRRSDAALPAGVRIAGYVSGLPKLAGTDASGRATAEST